MDSPGRLCSTYRTGEAPRAGSADSPSGCAHAGTAAAVDTNNPTK
ncbi:hypothetical protein [Pseudoxanthomonas winnipegensis]|nr:hypothetical protein [Pseudoxanthomonas winnipegensis]